LAIGGGAWEAWCGSTSLYVWARFDSVTIPSPTHCTDTSSGHPVDVKESLQAANSSIAITPSGSAVAYGSDLARGSYSILAAEARTAVVVEGTATQGTAGTAGAGVLWLSAHALPCPGESAAPDQIVAGVSFDWM